MAFRSGTYHSRSFGVAYLWLTNFAHVHPQWIPAQPFVIRNLRTFRAWPAGTTRAPCRYTPTPVFSAMNTTTIAATLLRRTNVNAIIGENLVHHDDVDGPYRPYGALRIGEPAKPAKAKKLPPALPPKKKTETVPATTQVA